MISLSFIEGDTFRNTVSLYHLIQPEAYESQIRSLIDIWRHQGYMPDVRTCCLRIYKIHTYSSRVVLATIMGWFKAVATLTTS
jgi:hypothetical protein